MSSSQTPQHVLTSTAEGNKQEDFEFKDDLLNRECVTSCLTVLYDRMIVDEVVTRLQANKILTSHEADLTRAEKTPYEKNRILIDFVQKRGPEAFSCFMKSLTETGQKYIFDKLIEERIIIAKRAELSALSMWSTKLMSATKKVNLESLITEELEQLKDIRVNKIPEQIGQIGKGAYGKVLLFKFEDGSFRAGKKPKISLENKSPIEENQMKKYLGYALGEIKMLHQLNHDRVIKLYGFYLDQSQMIIFMEAMRGSVKDEINEKGCLSEVEAMNYFIHATEGVVYLHNRRPAIVHRDIKCENLLLTAEYNVKLTDFGSAINLIIDNGSKTNLSTAPNSFVGTHLFHAPEVIQTVNKPEAYGRKSDIWSLACTLVQMISGEPPYRHLSLIELIQRSSVTSQNPLKYSGDALIPAASNEIKKLLDSMFIINSAIRPDAEKVLALAQSVAKTFSDGRDIENKFENGDQRQTLNSITNGFQSINMNNKLTLIEGTSAENVHNVSNLVPAFQQQTTSDEGDYGKNLSGIPKAKEDSSLCRNEAEQGDAEAQNKLGEACYFGQGVNQSYEEAVKWYRKAADQGDPHAQNNLGLMYQNGRGVFQSDEEAVEWYAKSAEQGNAEAQFNLGLMYDKGRGVTRSDKDAVKWYRKSAEQAHSNAQINLGIMYRDGRGVLKSDEEAVKCFRKSAEQGNVLAQIKLGNMYSDGRGVPKSGEEAVKWYRKAAEQGYAAAQYQLGYMYANGMGVPESIEEAVKWYINSAEQGYSDAQFQLGYMFLIGKSVPQSVEEAVKWGRKSAEQGNEAGENLLGCIYKNGGKGVPQSEEEAVKYFRKSAEQGNPVAQNNLGAMYENGKGIYESNAEALMWYTKSAEQGYKYGQESLGWMHIKGKGVPKSYEEGVKWLMKSAEQGNTGALYRLKEWDNRYWSIAKMAGFVTHFVLYWTGHVEYYTLDIWSTVKM